MTNEPQRTSAGGLYLVSMAVVGFNKHFQEKTNISFSR